MIKHPRRKIVGEEVFVSKVTCERGEVKGKRREYKDRTLGLTVATETLTAAFGHCEREVLNLKA